ncbi:MAG: hypothetical protein IPN68_07260 [Bacteroidetes bacterium]|nr:hypothetical protein [Bacteroidota bacterium]
MITSLKPLFELSGDSNLTSFYSALLLLFISGLLFLITNLIKLNINKYEFRWVLLSVIFLYLSVDESVNIHARLGAVFKKIIGSGNLPDYFQYGWVLPYLIVLVFLSLYFARFFFSFDRKTIVRFAIAFIVYVTGAAGMEMIESKFHVLYGTYHLMYKILVAIEEIMEMTGSILFIRALLIYISENFADSGIKVVRK